MRSLGSCLRVACLLTGAVIGAGFASGREIVAFFTPLGPSASLGLVVATAALAAGAKAIATLALASGSTEYGGLARLTLGDRAGAVLDGLLTAFLYLTAAVTLAGGAALLSEGHGVASGLALAITAGLAVLLTARGAPVLMRAGTALVPILVAALLLVIAGSLIPWAGSQPHDGSTPAAAEDLPRDPALPGQPGDVALPPKPGTAAAVVAGLLYAGFNLLLGLGVIAAGVSYEPPRPAIMGSALAGVLLGALAAAIHAAIVRSGDVALRAEVPVAVLAARLGPTGVYAYSLCLFLAILTTAAAATTSLAERIRPQMRAVSGGTSTAPLFVLAAALPAQLGFARLVQLVYPPMGLLGLIWLWRLLCLPLQQERGRRPPTL